MIERKEFTCILLTNAIDDLLTSGALNSARTGVDEIDPVAQELHGVRKTLGRFGFHQKLKLPGQLVDRVESESHRHATLRSQGIDRNGEGGDLAIDRRLLEKKGFSAAG